MTVVAAPTSRRVRTDSRRNLRIGLLCHRGVGGSVRTALELGAELARSGCDVHVFSRSPPMGMKAPAGVKFHTLSGGTSEGILTSRLDAQWSPAEIDELVECILSVAQAEQLDVLHFHYAVPFAEVLDRVRRELGSRSPALIGTLHGTDVSSQPCAMLAAALRRLDAVTTVSRSHAALAAHTFGLEKPVLVIPNFVDADRFQPGSERSSSKGTRPRILHVSNFRQVKHPESMARIFVAVRRQIDTVLWLVGDGECMASARVIFERANVNHDVHCFGLRTDVQNIMRDADVLLVTSRTESFCLAALEAAACGVPAVAPRVGGLPEIVADRQTGLLFESGNEQAAADAIVQLLGEPALREKMSRASVEHAQNLSAAAIVPRYKQLYRDMICLRDRPVSTVDLE